MVSTEHLWCAGQVYFAHIENPAAPTSPPSPPPLPQNPERQSIFNKRALQRVQRKTVEVSHKMTKEYM